MFYVILNHDTLFSKSIIQFKQSSPERMHHISSMVFDSLSNSLLTFYFNGIALLDTSLEQKAVYNYSQIGTFFQGSAININNYYFR